MYLLAYCKHSDDYYMHSKFEWLGDNTSGLTLKADQYQNIAGIGELA